MSLAKATTALRSAPAPSPPEDAGSDATATVQATDPAWDPARRRLFLKIAGAALLVAVLAPALLWAQYQNTHVVTRNALVRSHLSELGVRVEGVITDVLVAAGDTVKQGDLLARLDDTHLQARRVEAQAALAALEERLQAERAALDFAREDASVTLDRTGARFRRMQAEAEAASVQEADAAAVYASRRALGPGGAISAEALREAAARAATRQSLAAAAAAAALEAQAEFESARLAEEALAVREAELRVLAAKRREAAAKLARVEADIAGTRVHAPADGAVVRRLAQPGMAVGPGTPVLSLWLHEDTWIEAWIPEEELSDLQAGSAVQVSFPALPGERFSGYVARIGLATDYEMPLDYLPQTREMRMRPTPQLGVLVRLDAAPELMRPGMSAIVDIRRGGA